MNEEGDQHHEDSGNKLVACDTCYNLYDENIETRTQFKPDSVIAKLLSLRHLNCIKRLIQQRKESKEVLILAAAAFGYNDCLQVILSNVRIEDIFGRNGLGSKAVHMAARRGQCEILETLLETGINPDCRLDAGPSGLTATYLAAANGHKDCLKLLLKAGGTGSLVPAFSPLYGAVINGHTNCIPPLIERNICGNDQGGEVLKRLASEGNISSLELIITNMTNMGLQEVHKDLERRIVHIPMLRDNIQAAARQAAQYGHAECLGLLLHNTFSDIYSTLSVQDIIHDAASNGHLNCLSIILDCAITVNSDDAVVATSEKGHLDCLQLLFEYNGISPLARDQAVLESAVNGHERCLRFLFEVSNGFLSDYMCQSVCEEAIVGAAANGHFVCLNLLFREKLTNPSNFSSIMIEKAILDSIEGKHPSCLQLLYEKLHNNVTTDIHYKAIHRASTIGRTACLQKLLDTKTFCRSSLCLSHSQLQTTLLEAAVCGNDDCAELITSKTNVSIADKPELCVGYLVIAASVWNYDGLRSLLQLGAMPNIPAPKGTFNKRAWWPMCLDYTSESRIEYPTYFSRSGPLYFCRSILDGDLPLLAAIKFNALGSVKILLEWGANPNIMDQRGDIPLTVAAMLGHAGILKLLLQNGAHPDLCNAVSQKTALEYAAEMCRPACVKVLLQYNARVDLARGSGRKFRPHIEKVFDIGGCCGYAKLPGYREWYPFVKSNNLLQQLCRSLIRKHLVLQNPGSNLFCMVPKLPLPQKIRHYVLYNR